MKKGWKVLKNCILSVPEPDFLIVPLPCEQDGKVTKKTSKKPEAHTAEDSTRRVKRPKG
jgi:hypothetical protein